MHKIPGSDIRTQQLIQQATQEMTTPEGRQKLQKVLEKAREMTRKYRQESKPDPASLREPLCAENFSYELLINPEAKKLIRQQIAEEWRLANT